MSYNLAFSSDFRFIDYHVYRTKAPLFYLAKVVERIEGRGYGEAEFLRFESMSTDEQSFLFNADLFENNINNIISAFDLMPIDCHTFHIVHGISILEPESYQLFVYETESSSVMEYASFFESFDDLKSLLQSVIKYIIIMDVNHI